MYQMEALELPKEDRQNLEGSSQSRFGHKIRTRRVHDKLNFIYVV